MADYDMAVDRAVETREFKSGKLSALPIEIEYKINQDRYDLFYTIADNLPVKILVTRGPEHRIIFANTACMNSFQDSLGKRLTEICPALLREKFMPLFDQAFLTGETILKHDCETVNQLDNCRWWTFYILPYREEDKVNGLVAIFRETTTAVKARQFREQEVEKACVLARMLESVIDSMPEPVLLIAQNGQVIKANSAAIDFFDLSQIYPLPPISYPDLIRRVFPESDQLRLAVMSIYKALQGEKLPSVRLVLKLARRASTVVKMSSAPVRDEQGEIICVISVIRDITEPGCFDRAKDELLSVAIHELRNPLAVAQGMIQLIKMRFKQRTEIVEQLGEQKLDQVSDLNSELFNYRKDIKQLDSVLRNIDQMSRVISDLMDATKIETGHLQINNQPINLMELTDEVIQRIQATTTNHQLRNITNPNNQLDNECWVFGDYLRLEQVLVNLLTNAIKYSHPGQAILVRVKTRDKWAIVSVKDDGIGIPKRDQAFLFQRFFRASNVDRLQQSGLGLGLFISANIIREHGGQMWVKSEPGCGSTFYFSLPLDDDRLADFKHQA